VEVVLWSALVAFTVGLAYTLQFSQATLSLGRSLAGTSTGTGVQDAVTPPWQTNLALVVYIGLAAVLAGMWWQLGWASTLIGLVAVFIGSAISGAAFSKLGASHYRRLILASMAARYANYRRVGDTVRADAMRQLLVRAGIDPTIIQGT
jgi:hypothetical protein